MIDLSKIPYHERSLAVINTFMDTGKPFTTEQVCQVILFYEGILRVSILLPIKEYLQNLADEHILTSSCGWYQAGEKMLSLKGFPPRVVA